MHPRPGVRGRGRNSFFADLWAGDVYRRERGVRHRDLCCVSEVVKSPSLFSREVVDVKHKKNLFLITGSLSPIPFLPLSFSGEEAFDFRRFPERRPKKASSSM